jgi:DNA-binding NarL/FixJ family response regulator
MAKSRYVFVCKDGKPLPEWLKLPGLVTCVAAGSLDEAATALAEMVWIRLPEGGAAHGIDVDLVKRLSAATRTIVMSDIPQDQQALTAFEAGARGYCNSHSNSKALKLIAGVVRDGGLWIGESLMQRMVLGVGKRLGNHQDSGLNGQLSSTPKTDKNGNLMASLTEREREVAETVAGGASNKEVARLLQISERTVKAHVSTIFHKLGVRDRLQLSIKIIMLS